MRAWSYMKSFCPHVPGCHRTAMPSSRNTAVTHRQKHSSRKVHLSVHLPSCLQPSHLVAATGQPGWAQCINYLVTHQTPSHQSQRKELADPNWVKNNTKQPTCYKLLLIINKINWQKIISPFHEYHKFKACFQLPLSSNLAEKVPRWELSISYVVWNWQCMQESSKPLKSMYHVHIVNEPVLYETHILSGFMENICRDFCHWDFHRQIK